MKKLAIISLSGICSLYAGGYKIPETSLNSVALCSANIAHNTNADTAYYNPANMVYVDDTNKLEVGFTYIGLSATRFKGSVSGSEYDIAAKSETFLVPNVHYVSNKADDLRFGLSIVSPGGLTKRWDVSPAKDKAEEFTLQIVEVNPTVALSLSKNLSIAAGVRVLQSSGVVKSTSVISRDMEGDSIDYGYNLALAYKASTELEFGLTYRSEVSLTQEGSAKLFGLTGLDYDGGAKVSVPLPATLSAGVSYTLASDTTVEFVYNRNYWSAYKTLDFDYAQSIGELTSIFDDPIAKDWKDSNTYRLGVTQELDELRVMAGIVYDETPIPEKSLSFELPDSSALSVSFGGRYKIDNNFNAGLSMLYSMRDNREASNDDLSGEFSNTNALLISTAVEYKF